MFDPIQLLNIGAGEPLHVDYQIFFWIMMSLNLLFIAIAKTINQEYLPVLFSTGIVNRYVVQKVQEELKLGSASSILLTLTYFINMAIILAYLAEKEYGSFMLIIFGILVGAALVKWGVMWSVMFISETRTGITEHGMNHLIFYQVGGIILTPVLFISHFLPENIYSIVVQSCLFLAVFLILVREFQSIARALKARISPLYIILYLCTLELMPFVLIIYAFVNKNSGLN